MRTKLIARLSLLLVAAAVVAVEARAAEEPKPLRPPAVPLVACDPYFSIWSAADRLTDDATRHWTGKPHAAGEPGPHRRQAVPPDGRRAAETCRPAADEARRCCPRGRSTSSQAAEVRVTLTFLTPALPEDLDVLSRPVTYVDLGRRPRPTASSTPWASTSTPAGEIAVNTPEQAVVCVAREGRPAGRRAEDRLEGSAGVAKKGDDLRIDWGYLYAAAAVEKARPRWPRSRSAARAFATDGSVGADDDAAGPPGDGRPVAAAPDRPGQGRREKPASRWLMLAYDDIYAIQYFGQNLRPYWRRSGAERGRPAQGGGRRLRVARGAAARRSTRS